MFLAKQTSGHVVSITIMKKRQQITAIFHQPKENLNLILYYSCFTKSSNQSTHGTYGKLARADRNIFAQL